ncbi:hypothetical protein PFISCL1PPCAC_6693, partial [Pristionchus fissidentatus]
ATGSHGGATGSHGGAAGSHIGATWSHIGGTGSHIVATGSHVEATGSRVGATWSHIGAAEWVPTLIPRGEARHLLHSNHCRGRTAHGRTLSISIPLCIHSIYSSCQISNNSFLLSYRILHLLHSALHNFPALHQIVSSSSLDCQLLIQVTDLLLQFIHPIFLTFLCFYRQFFN